MVREITVFQTREAQAEAFVEAYRGVANVLTDAEGSRDASSYRGVEDPKSFTSMVGCVAVDARPALTRKPEFGSFGEAIARYLAGQPEVRHVEAVG